MRKLDGEQVLMRVFIGENDRWQHRPLHTALLELFRREGLAGATVLRAVAGFGPDSVDGDGAPSRDGETPGPELTSSDYLYDLVVLGLLEALGRSLPV